jgi:anti-anti-sigma factor
MPQRYQQGCVDVIRCDEKLIAGEVAELQVLLEHSVSKRLPQIVADLRRVRIIDSVGLELLYDTQKECLSRGGVLRLAAAGALVKEVLRVTGLEQEFELHPDVISAAGAFAV